MGNTKKYWTGLEELDNTAAFKESMENEFPQEQSVDEFLSDDKLKETSTGRRDFLKFMGFSVAAATLAACETPVTKSIPYVNKPEEITPGVANYYASTFYDGSDYGNLLVKTREGRPILIKSNREHGIDGGALNARINSSILPLYDSARLKQPKVDGQDATWQQVDERMSSALQAGGNIKVLTSSIASPTTQKAINQFVQAHNAEHIQYDAVSYAGMRKANKADFGVDGIPKYDFSKAKTIVSISADFLANWLMHNQYVGQYAKTRKPDGDWMSKHFQFETVMSLTGTNADHRTAIKPSQEGLVAAALLNAVGGGPSVDASGLNENAIIKAAEALKSTRGESLVVSGSNDPQVQTLVNAINAKLGNYGSTIDLSNPINLFKGDDEKVAQLVSEMNSGSVDTMIVYGCNPAYSWYDTEAFRTGLEKVKNSACFNLFSDETASRCAVQAPDTHFLEGWNDFSPYNGRVDLAQPTIAPLFNSRPAQENFLKWSGNNEDYYTYLRKNYNAAYTKAKMNSDKDWNMAVLRGTMKNAPVKTEMATEEGDQQAAAAIAFTGDAIAASKAAAQKASQAGEGFEIAFYQKVGIGTGNQASNPWLQELPDPVSRLTWDNYITMSPSDIDELGYNRHISEREYASMAKVTVNGKEVTLPVYPQPGQKRGTVGIALGYGRGDGLEEIGKAAFTNADFTPNYNAGYVPGEKEMAPIGKNVFPMATMINGLPVYHAVNAQLEKQEVTYPLASVQIHGTVMGRDSVVKETTFSTYKAESDKPRGQASFNEYPTLTIHEDVNGDGEITAQDRQRATNADLWKEHAIKEVGHRWGMAIDLSSCIGCGACVTSCHIENNVPVVGKDEVRRYRDMHWMRIDRYYSSDMTKEKAEEQDMGKISMYEAMEDPAENPQTVFMPVMCQHCNHAPCETVCPVLATSHSDEGLNQMTYNRCIGTRYCANNCPYKVRRFNWFNYQDYAKFEGVNPAQDSLMRMVLNPDVTVRSRGVMEKCSMCVQRIQSGKLEAKREGTPVPDGLIQTACADACPTNAITFGDLNDKKSSVNNQSADVRSYNMLEETGTRPNIYYQVKVRNIEESDQA
ncbi:TAT-variant-translocated molybdopterin oxidoreductase [Halocola ammonii]